MCYRMLLSVSPHSIEIFPGAGLIMKYLLKLVHVVWSNVIHLTKIQKKKCGERAKVRSEG